MSLAEYKAKSGKLIPVYRLEIQTRPDDADRVLDAVMTVHSLKYGRYKRNASVSATGAETGQPEDNSTTTTHVEGFEAGGTETYPMAELKFSMERDPAVLAQVMDAIHEAHQYEEPVIYVREEWASRAAYDPNNENPNRWWNDERGLPGKVPFAGTP